MNPPVDAYASVSGMIWSANQYTLFKERGKGAAHRRELAVLEGGCLYKKAPTEAETIVQNDAGKRPQKTLFEMPAG